MTRVVELDWIEPVLLAQRLRHLPGLAFLDSAMPHPECGRYSFVAADPFLEIEAREGKVLVGGVKRDGDPLDILSDEIARYRNPTLSGLPPFQGGAIGYFGYDLSARYEGSIPRRRLSAGNDMHVAFYDVVLAFDHVTHRGWIISTGFPELDQPHRDRRAKERAEWFFWLACTVHDSEDTSSDGLSLEWQSNFDAPSYREAVEQVREHIRSGDIFQANISQKFEAKLPAHFDPWGFYRRAREVNAATFGAYLELGNVCVASCSPERFLRVSSGGDVETRPIKGTIKRAENDPEQDKWLALELSNSPKDRAENVMIVDLLRNDLSRSCVPDSVKVEALCSVESYAGLHHLVSTIRGHLAPMTSPIQLFRECFPGGSITGAPKIRAMEIIAEIEGVNRGLYCGAIGYVSFDGAMDTSIVIRTVQFIDGMASFNVGGGITFLSEPDAEYLETLTKAQKVLASFAAVRSA